MTIPFFGALSRVVRLADRLGTRSLQRRGKRPGKIRGKEKAPASESGRYKDRRKYRKARGAEGRKALSGQSRLRFDLLWHG
jgi:hypothetical protein